MPKEHETARTRVLSDDEIRTLINGFDQTRYNTSRGSSAANVMLDSALDFMPELYLCRIPDRFSSPISRVGRDGGAGSHRALCGSPEL